MQPSDQQPSDVERQVYLALKLLRAKELALCIDPNDLDSRPYTQQQEIFNDIERYIVRAVVAANQTGKSTVGGRECAWIFERNHPWFKVPDHPIKLLVIGRVGEQVESELWAAKIKPFLAPGTYKEVKSGNSLQRVEHLENGNMIIFMSHHNVNEAREKAQSYVAYWVWLDELPGSLALISELLMRVQSLDGRFLLTFTPLVKIPAIRKWIEGLDPRIGRKYKMRMLDNPKFRGREELILLQYKDLPENERRARLEGDWFESDQLVYSVNDDRDLRNPEGYHQGWRHVEVVDPAASGVAGFMLLAEHPTERKWYVVRADYVKGAAASDLLPEFTRRTEHLNVVRRICDPHEVWFIKEASKVGRLYAGVYDKANRKNELVKNSQEALLGERVRIATWCTDFRDELSTAQWSETVKDKIVNGHKYHLIDCFQYGFDSLPKDLAPAQTFTPQELLKRANTERRRSEVARKKTAGKGRVVKRLFRSNGRTVHMRS